MEPRGSQEQPRASKSVKERPRRVPRAAKSVQERPKSVPRASQERPKSVPRAAKSGQESEVGAQDVSKKPPEHLLEGSWEAFGSILEAFGCCLGTILELEERI